MAPLLQMLEITKDFPGVRALGGVSFELEGGQVHALVGENGAGKSTLMKILGGVYPSHEYDGTILVDGVVHRFRSVHDATSAGIAVVYQELSLVPEMTVAENIFLGSVPSRFGFVAWDELYARAEVLLNELGLAIDPHLPVERLGIGQQQLVEIAKALSRNARILVLDEPTAALTGGEVQILESILEGLRRRSVGIVYISHKLEEVFHLADVITVLRDGHAVATHRASELDEARVIAMMVGREVTNIFPPREHEPGETVFEARNVTVEDPNVPGKLLVDRVSFSVRAGEVLGIAGLMGAGRSDLLMALFGAHEGRHTGEIFVAGEPVTIGCPRDAIRNGIAFVTEDRKRYGLVHDESILSNQTLADLRRLSGAFFTDMNREAAVGESSARELRIKASSVFVPAGTLSGGNQQKVVLSRWLLTKPRVIFLDEPTRGIDVGAKQEIYVQIEALARAGLGVVLVSSELPEVLGLSDRVLVLREGRGVGELTRAEATPERVMERAAGGGR